MTKKIIASILIILFITFNYTVFATNTISNYQSQKKETEAEIKQSEENLNQITSQKNSIQQEVSELNESISEVQSELSDLQDKIENLDKSIKSKQEDLDEKQKLLDERLAVVYRKGTNTYLEALFSGGLINFISNYDMIKQIAEYDNNLINQVKEAKTNLENEKKELQEAKNEVEQKKSSLEKQKSEREEKVKSLTQEEQEIQKIIEEKEAEISKINAAVKAEQKRIEEERKKAEAEAAKKPTNSSSSSQTNTSQSSTSTSNNSNQSNSANTSNSSASMAWPTRLTHKVNSVYAPGGRTDTSGYVGTKHKGVDIYAPEGAPIYAAKSGTVVYVNYSGYGGGWFLYVVIYQGTDSKGNAVYTRYAHASKIASGISVGTKVTTNTVIMYSGNTGASEGAHLHFEVCLNSMYNQVNPCPYLGITNTRGNH